MGNFAMPVWQDQEEEERRRREQEMPAAPLVTTGESAPPELPEGAPPPPPVPSEDPTPTGVGENDDVIAAKPMPEKPPPDWREGRPGLIDRSNQPGPQMMASMRAPSPVSSVPSAAPPAPVKIPAPTSPTQYDEGGDETPSANDQFQQNQATKSARPPSAGGTRAIGQGPQQRAYEQDLEAYRTRAAEKTPRWKNIVGNILMGLGQQPAGDQLMGNKKLRDMRANLAVDEQAAEQERLAESAGSLDAYHRASTENQYAQQYYNRTRAEAAKNAPHNYGVNQNVMVPDPDNPGQFIDIRKGTAPKTNVTLPELALRAANGDASAKRALAEYRAEPDKYDETTEWVDQGDGTLVRMPKTTKHTQTVPSGAPPPAPVTKAVSDAPPPAPGEVPMTPKFAPGQPNREQKASRYNNPYNLHFDPDNPMGGVLADDGKSAQFQTPEDGMQAGEAYIERHKERGFNLGSYLSKFAPPNENDTAKYIANAEQVLGVSKMTPLSQIDSNKLAQFQMGQESSSGKGIPSPATGATAPSKSPYPGMSVPGAVIGGHKTPPRDTRHTRPAPNVLNDEEVHRIELLRTGLQNNLEFKKFEVVRDQTANIMAAIQQDNGVGDLALLRAFANLTDPLTGVREEEYRNMAGATGVMNQVRVFLANKWKDGVRLSPESRQEFLAMSQEILKYKQQKFGELAGRIAQQAQAYGVDPKYILEGYVETPPDAKRPIKALDPDGGVHWFSDQRGADQFLILSRQQAGRK